ncbi:MULTISPECIES: hypothetical protein [unclassified Saccharicrinis]|uniref:hypothetical protein n=1 Tax=unclassified Saccharicrinis TaxID=2646859 RepID=UPI003D327DCD
MLLPIGTMGQSAYLNSPVSLGRGGTGTASFDSWSVLTNPAGTSKTTQIAASVSYYLPYFVHELSSKNALVVLPYQFGVLAVNINQFGYSLYQENNIGLSYSRSITPTLHAAFQFNFQNTDVSQSGSGSQLFAGVGVIYEPMDAVQLGCFVSNPERSKITVQDISSQIPSLFVLGFNWNASTDFDISCELEKQDGFKSLFKLGLEYEIKEMVWIRTGLFGKPLNYTFGLGFNVFDFQLDAGMSHHDVLGISSCFGITYLFRQNQ